MSINVLPNFEIFHSVLVREVNYEGVEDTRAAYNRVIDIVTIHNGVLLLPTLIEDKLKKNIKGNQREHFYSPLTRDFSTSGKAGFKYDTCLIETAITNSYERHTLILSTEGPIHDQDLIKNNKKIAIMTPHKFLSCCKLAESYVKAHRPKAGFMGILQFFIFINPRIFDDVYKNKR